MMHCYSTFLFLLLLLTTSGGSSTDSGPMECTKVPSSAKFLTTLKTAINAMPHVTSAVSGFADVVDDDFHLSNAVSDCLDLLDFSGEVLDWSLSAASQNCTGSKHKGADDLSFDLQTWLGAALTNMDTCIDGFEGVKLQKDVSNHVGRVTPLLEDLLASVTSGCTNRFRSSSWFEDEMVQAGMEGVVQVNVTVAVDGSGNFTTVGEAVEAAPEKSSKRFVIYVKKGVYKENVLINKKKWNIMMIGDGVDGTVISGNRSVFDGWTTFRTATFAVNGKGFIARDITFENTAGPSKHQAVALRSDADLAVFYRCAMRGYQDTLYVHNMRQFFRECWISGTVDFIFGNGAAVFQSCQIMAKKGLPNQKNTVTAQGRKYQNDPTGFSIQFCNITADADLLPSVNSTETYLGRPWKRYSRTVIMQSYLSDIIRPKGWLEWDGNFALDSLFYGEYMNNGPGAGLGGRVKWAGYHVLNGSEEASNYSVAKFIEGNTWLPDTGVKYVAGLD